VSRALANFFREAAKRPSWRNPPGSDLDTRSPLIADRHGPDAPLHPASARCGFAPRDAGSRRATYSIWLWVCGGFLRKRRRGLCGVPRDLKPASALTVNKIRYCNWRRYYRHSELINAATTVSAILNCALKSVASRARFTIPRWGNTNHR
jgi:hypothetical protein